MPVHSLNLNSSENLQRIMDTKIRKNKIFYLTELKKLFSETWQKLNEINIGRLKTVTRANH